MTLFLIDDYKLTIQEAPEILYTSETFERLQDNATGLYYQSAGYVYSFLQNELKNGKVAWKNGSCPEANLRNMNRSKGKKLLIKSAYSLLLAFQTSNANKTEVKAAPIQNQLM